MIAALVVLAAIFCICVLLAPPRQRGHRLPGPIGRPHRLPPTPRDAAWSANPNHPHWNGGR